MVAAHSRRDGLVPGLRRRIGSLWSVATTVDSECWLRAQD